MRVRPALPPFVTAAALALVPLVGCVPAPEPTQAPAPAPAPAPTPSPTPPPPSPSFAGDWMDAPLTPGDWRYTERAATFAAPDGSPLLVLRCTGGTVAFERAGTSTAQSFVLRSETASRSLSPTSAGGWTSASLPAQDSLLDAIAFSKGRFAVENAGLPTLYIPSYPEVTRVIEDCR